MDGSEFNQSPIIRDDGVDKKKKRRQNKKLNQKYISPVNGGHREALKCLQNGSSSSTIIPSSSHSFSSVHRVPDGLNETSSVDFNLFPTMNFNEQLNLEEARAMERHPIPSPDIGQIIYPQSCPIEIPREVLIGPSINDEFISSHQNRNDTRPKLFSKHLSMEAIFNALKKGDAFRVLFRVNAHNRLEAYCTIDGVNIDILINGISAQNRAIEGDVVAIKIDSAQLWPRMKQSNGLLTSSAPLNDCNSPIDGTDKMNDSCKWKNRVNTDYEADTLSGKIIHPELVGEVSHCSANGNPSSSETCSNGQNEIICALNKLVNSFPYKRPTGRVVRIIERSPRRDTVIGFLNAKHWIYRRVAHRRPITNNKVLLPFSDEIFIQLIPSDQKLPKMRVPVDSLHDSIKKRLICGDATVGMELVGARIDDWTEESLIPNAHVLHTFGRGNELEPRIASILFENAICSEFSQESLSCLPHASWEVPSEEFSTRMDLRNLCIFTIDPASATDLDDALSIQQFPNGIYRAGVHIADASYFVKPHTALDIEAQIRSTSVYMLQRKVPMLPLLLSENFASLHPGVDRLTFSMFLDINPEGDVIDHWIGRTVVQSCCKLSYEHAQRIIDGGFIAESSTILAHGLPQLHGGFSWVDITQSVRNLFNIFKILKCNRFNAGAVSLDNPKVGFSFDENGIPSDCMLCEQQSSQFLVEEFMLLANRTAAEITSRSYPHIALLRRHPEPDFRKLRELEEFCSKHGLELDTSSGKYHQSLQKIRENLKDDPALFDILIFYATKPMQLATYFCSGALKETVNGWGHYSLAFPCYTHFTSPLRRYPDILVHRTLSAVIESEHMYLKNKTSHYRCFTGKQFNKDAADSIDGQKALSAAASNHGLPSTDILADLATICNDRALACRRVKDACDKLCMWVLLKNKEDLLSEARVLSLGPRFMSIYIQKLAIERRINYDDVEGLKAEWFENTSTLLLNFSETKRHHGRNSLGKCRTLGEVALVVNPNSLNSETDPMVFPLTVHILSPIQVALYAIGGDDGPIDIGAKLYVGSYFA